MQQPGHTTPTLALSIYNRVLERKRDKGERMSELLRGPDADAGIDLDDAAQRLGVAGSQSNDRDRWRCPGARLGVVWVRGAFHEPIQAPIHGTRRRGCFGLSS